MPQSGADTTDFGELRGRRLRGFGFRDSGTLLVFVEASRTWYFGKFVDFPLWFLQRYLVINSFQGPETTTQRRSTPNIEGMNRQALPHGLTRGWSEGKKYLRIIHTYIYIYIYIHTLSFTNLQYC